MNPFKTFSLIDRSLLPAALLLLGLLALGCEEVGGSSGGSHLSSARSLAELIEVSGFDQVTTAQFRAYDTDEHDFATPPDQASFSLIQWAGPSPCIGIYDTFDVADYPLSNGRKQFARVSPGDRKFAVYDIDPVTGSRVEGIAHGFYGVKDLLRVPGTSEPAVPLAIPILILVEEIICESGAPAYRAIRVLEGELLAYSVAGGPTWNGVPGSLFSGQLRQLIVEAYSESWKPFEGQEVQNFAAYMQRL